MLRFKRLFAESVEALDRFHDDRIDRLRSGGAVLPLTFSEMRRPFPSSDHPAAEIKGSWW